MICAAIGVNTTNDNNVLVVTTSIVTITLGLETVMGVVANDVDESLILNVIKAFAVAAHEKQIVHKSLLGMGGGENETTVFDSSLFATTVICSIKVDA